MPRETKSTKTAQRQKKDRDRQQTRRDEMVEERRPDTHAVDRAVSEAVAYVMAGYGMAGIPPLEIVVSVVEVSQVAGTILAKRYDYELSAAGVGLWRGGQEAVTAPYVDRYFADLPDTARLRSGWMLGDAAQYFFPGTSLEEETLAKAQALVADGSLDLSLRRRLADAADELERLLAVRRAFPHE